MNTLANFPLVNQLSEPTKDGQTDENARMNCVPASIAAALTWYSGRNRYVGDQLKDAVYGQGYTGTMGASHFVGYCAKLNIKLYPVNSSQAGLVSALHSYVKRGVPCLVTMTGQWSTAPADPVNPGTFTHVGVCVGEGAGTLRVMNPWGGFWQDESDAWWQARLCYGQVWPMERIGDFAVLDISQTNGYFTQNSDGSWQCRNGQKLYGGILAFYRNNAGYRLFGLPITDELQPDPSYQGRVRLFERGAIAFDPSHKWDKVATEPDASCYAAHIESGYVLTRLSAALQGELDKANKALAAANVQVDTLTKQLAAANASLTQARAERDAAKAAQADAEAKLQAALQNQSDAQSAVSSLKKAMGF